MRRFDPRNVTTLPHIYQAYNQDSKENRHLQQGEPSPTAILCYKRGVTEDSSPRENKNQFDIEQQEDQRYHVKTGVKLNPRTANGFLATFVCTQLYWIGLFR